MDQVFWKESRWGFNYCWLSGLYRGSESEQENNSNFQHNLLHAVKKKGIKSGSLWATVLFDYYFILAARWSLLLKGKQLLGYILWTAKGFGQSQTGRKLKSLFRFPEAWSLSYIQLETLFFVCGLKIWLLWEYYKRRLYNSLNWNELLQIPEENSVQRHLYPSEFSEYFLPLFFTVGPTDKRVNEK